MSAKTSSAPARPAANGPLHAASSVQAETASSGLHGPHIVLYQPEIPPNTGNVARLCAATGTELHLIQPLGFSLEDRYLKRAGLDYWPHVRLFVWECLEAYIVASGQGRRLVATSSRSGVPLHHFAFTRHDALLLGPETQGLPEQVLEGTLHRVRIPIHDTVRSLNLSTAAGILLYQALAGTGMLDAFENAPSVHGKEAP